MRGMKKPARQLLLLCDGTNNNLSGWQADTHVVLLAELLRRHPDAGRLVYYDPGVGNPGVLPGTTWVDKAGRVGERLVGLAFGRGVFDNIAEGYRFLMQHWEPGDEIWLFGFSRGAFTARSIGGLVNAFGIVERQHETLLPSLVSTYFARADATRKAVGAQMARLFAQGDDAAARPKIHFVGVWDTVASVGLPPFNLRISARPDLAGKHFRHVRQALALDEQRAQFKPRAYAQDDGEFALADASTGSIRQRWFRGSHCDVGGGNPYAGSEQARAPFAWMLAEAARCGLRLPVQGLDLRDEAQVPQVLAALEAGVPGSRGTPSLSSQTRAMPLWALTGLAVRHTERAELDDAPDAPVRMAAHPSVAAWTAPFPEGSAWRARWSARRRALLGVLLLAVLALPLALGQLHTGASGWPDAAQAAAALDANLGFQRWQLLGAFATHADWATQLRSFVGPAKAVLWDFAYTGIWASCLALLVAPAFAQVAGLTPPGRAAPRWLNRLGWALPAAVGADLAENALSLAAMACARWDLDLLGWPLRLLLGAASAAKWLALAGVLALLGWGWFSGVGAAARARRASSPPDSPAA